MAKSLTDYEQFERSSPRNRQLLRQEEIILSVTDNISRIMAEQKLRKIDLARMMSKSPSWVTAFLQGRNTLPLRTLVNLADKLGYRVKVSFERR